MKSIAILLLIFYSVYSFIQPSTGCFFHAIPEDRQQVNWDKYNLAQQAFITCNDDGEEGLTWNEISACEEKFCALLSVECPTEEDFTAFDIDGDGILTWHEFMEVNLAIVGSERDSLSAIEALEL